MSDAAAQIEWSGDDTVATDQVEAFLREYMWRAGGVAERAEAEKWALAWQADDADLKLRIGKLVCPSG